MNPLPIARQRLILCAVLSVLALGAASSVLRAQQPGQPASSDRQRQAAERLEEAKKRLNLTPEQSEKIRPILQAEFARLKEIRDKHQGDTSRRGRISMLREMRSAQEDSQKQIKPILTSDQQKEWNKMRDEARARMKEEAARRR